MSINQTGQRVGSPSLFNQGPAQGGETPLNDQYAHTLRNQNRERQLHEDILREPS